MSLPTMRQLLAETAGDYGLTVDALKAFGNRRRFSWPRQDFMWRARQVKYEDGAQRFSYPQIAAVICRDHSSVVFGVARHKQRIKAAEAMGISVQAYIMLHAAPPPNISSKPPAWTRDEDRALRWAYANGARPKHICVALGRSYNSVLCRARRIGLPGQRERYPQAAHSRVDGGGYPSNRLESAG